jgi:hypothetical protein
VGIWGHEPVPLFGHFASVVADRQEKRKGEDKMADFFGELGKKISDTASDFSKKAEDTLEIQKIKSDIRSMKRANERDLRDIGRMVYEKFQKGEVDDTEYISLCEEVEKREEEIEKQEEQIVKIKEEI